MADDGLQLVMKRNLFYRDNYRRIVMLLLLMIIVNIALVVFVSYQFANRPSPKYFATTGDGKILPLYPLRAPMMSKTEILQWADMAATFAFTFDFNNWRKQLQEASNYFTSGGWTNFQDALKSSNNLETVIAKKLEVSAVSTGTPVILEQGIFNSRYSWKVQIPLLLTYQGAGSTTFQQPVVANMLITRVPVLNNPKGIAIAQFYVSTQPIESGT